MKILRAVPLGIAICFLLVGCHAPAKARQTDSRVEALLEEEAGGGVLEEPQDKPHGGGETPEDEPQIIKKYQNLYDANNDMIGFIYLPDGYRYPVVQRVEDQNHYEKHNFFGEPDREGAVFASMYTELGEQGISLIYGHNLKSGRMFSILRNYLEEGYFTGHSRIRIDTLYEEMEYEVVAVALTSLHEDFQYYAYSGFQTEASFHEWQEGFEPYCVIGSLSGLSYSDKVAELSTCWYHVEDGRLVVILRASD
ncbi:MAG: class B sortase [Lachnospiraceae bacterium]|nr:class B sortase [Lachnospiraceae bacterium]